MREEKGEGRGERINEREKRKEIIDRRYDKIDERRGERRPHNAGHIAIIVVVDLVPIQSHLDSGDLCATDSAENKHLPIHFISSNPTGMTATGPALRTKVTGPSV